MVGQSKWFITKMKKKKKELGTDEAPFIYLIESNKRYPQSNKEYDNGFCSKGCFWKILAKLNILAKKKS